MNEMPKRVAFQREETLALRHWPSLVLVHGDEYMTVGSKPGESLSGDERDAV